MNNLSVDTASASGSASNVWFTSVTDTTYSSAQGGAQGMSGGSSFCNLHGYGSCNCLTYPPLYGNVVVCSQCGQAYSPSGSLHFCSQTSPFTPTTGTNYPWTTTTITYPPILFPPALKNVKELTTDSELEYYPDNLVTATLKLPLKFSDCFIKVGQTHSPLYPLLLSGNEGDSEPMSFYLVTEISEKVFDDLDRLILKGVKLTKIEDNLSLMQLASKTRDHFKDK